MPHPHRVASRQSTSAAPYSTERPAKMSDGKTRKGSTPLKAHVETSADGSMPTAEKCPPYDPSDPSAIILASIPADPAFVLDPPTESFSCGPGLLPRTSLPSPPYPSPADEGAGIDSFAFSMYGAFTEEYDLPPYSPAWILTEDLV